MFTLLNSFLAWALLAAAIPILIHLFTRKKLKTAPFSTLQFLKEMQKEKIRQVKIRQILLLILRTLLILFLVMAFLRPTLKSNAAFVGDDANTAMAVIVDNSLSMGVTRLGQSKFTAAANKAKELAGIMQNGDEIHFITAGFPARKVNPEPVHSSSSALQTLAKIEQEAVGTDLDGALALAVDALARSNLLNKEIYLLSDNHAALPKDLANAGTPQNIRLFHLEWEEETARNLAITGLEIKNQIFELHQPTEVQITVANTGSVDENGKLVYLLLNGGRVAQTQIDVPANQERSVLMRVVPDKPGYQLLTAELENDNLLADNRRFGQFHIPEQTKVLLAGKTARDRLFVRLALGQSQTEGTLALTEVDADRLAAETFSAYDAVILCNIPRVQGVTAQKLQTFVEMGGGAMIFLGGDVDLRNYNDEVFARFEIGVLGESIGSLTDGANILRIGKTNFDHPVFQGIFSGEKEKREIDSPAFRFTVLARPNDEAEVIMRYSNDAPFLLEKRFKQGVLFTFLASADANWSDLTFKGIFAPLVNRSVRYVSEQGGSRGQEILTGETAATSLTGLNLQQFEVETPDKAVQRLRPQVKGGAYLVSLTETGDAGFYALAADQQTRFVWAANFDPAEPRQSEIDVEQLETIFGEENVLALPAEAPLASSIADLRFGTELWRLFLILALITALTEMLLFRSKAGE